MAEETLRKNLDILHELRHKIGKRSALFITNYQTESGVCLLHEIKESANHVYGYLEVNQGEDLKTALEYAKGRVDTILVDTHLLNTLASRDSIAQIVPATSLGVYSEEASWVDSIVAMVFALYSEQSLGSILIAGFSPLTHGVLQEAARFGVPVFWYRGPAPERRADNSYLQILEEEGIQEIQEQALQDHRFDLIVTTSIKEIVFDAGFVKYFDYRTIAMDAGIGGFSAEMIENLYTHDSSVIRIDNRASLSSILVLHDENRDLRENVMGALICHGVRIVAGGTMGMKNDVIVDSISRPTLVLGVADGAGRTLYPPYSKEIQKRVEIVRNAIAGAQHA